MHSGKGTKQRSPEILLVKLPGSRDICIHVCQQRQGQAAQQEHEGLQALVQSWAL